MGKALYRKHRSRSLDEVVGQDHITNTLKNALNKGAINHAYLFTGPRGVGKTSIARILAHEVNKLDYNDESIHLDIIEIDAASNRRIDEIRDLRDKVRIAPTSAKYKVYIIDEVHMLTREAFNALLKTLEEPPTHVIFILATTEAHKVPDTIISRTQRFTFRPITTTDAVKHLRNIAKQEKIDISDEALELLAEHGNGSFRDSISMLDQLSGLADDKLTKESVTTLLGLPDESMINNLITSVVKNDQKGLFDTIMQLREQGVGPVQAVKALCSKLRDGLVANDTLLSTQATIKLLQDLLPLTVGLDDYLKLELCLLDAMDLGNVTETNLSKPEKVKNFNNTEPKSESKPKKKPQVKEVRVNKKAVIEKPKGSKALTKSIKKLTNKNTKFSMEIWNNLLNDLKTSHNTLYGILRMAEPSQEGEVIKLIFNFGFHKKRVDSPNNSAHLRMYIEKYFGSPEFITTVKAKKVINKQPKPEPKNEPDAVVASVSNIFKGAQLLES